MADQNAKLSELQVISMQISDEEYGIPIMNVQEIVRVPAITRIPNMPDFLEGIINLRGKIVPVIDLKKKFGLSAKPQDEKTRIVVVNIEKQIVGFIVDSVSEVVRLSTSEIEPVPPTISSIGAEYLSGIGKLGKKILILLNLEKILTETEKSTLAQTRIG